MTSPTATHIGAWLLKCSPQRWDLPRFIRDGHRALGSWTLAVPDPRLAVGQPVLFWVTGPAGAVPTPGLWGAGVVTGRYYRGQGHGHEDSYWRTPPSEPGSSIWIPVDLTLFDAPIPRATLADDPRLHDLQILRMPIAGNPQQVTTRQLAVIERYLTSSGTASYGPSARARAIVIDTYRRKGWHVERATHPGWDLLCRRGAQVLRVVARPVDQIVVGRAEVAAANDPHWRLVVVDGSALIEYGGIQALDHAEPITYAIPSPQHHAAG